MLSVVAMSTSDTLLTSSFNPEVSSTSRDSNTNAAADCRIKREPNNEELLLSEERKDNIKYSPSSNPFQSQKSIIPLKTECVKTDSTFSERPSNPELTVTNNSPPPAPPKPKTSFLTSDILGDITTSASISPIHQNSPSVVVPPSSAASSIASPNDSTLSSNE